MCNFFLSVTPSQAGHEPCLCRFWQAAPSLDKTNLVVGKVVDGFDVVKQISGLPTVKDNRSSPYFR
jgi:cyclophilin family peptidyl-prolyl cis-trans isomerase